MEDFIEEILDRKKEKLEKGESLTRPSVMSESESDTGESSRSRPRSKPRTVQSKSRPKQQKPARKSKSR